MIRHTARLSLLANFLVAPGAPNSLALTSTVAGRTTDKAAGSNLYRLAFVLIRSDILDYAYGGKRCQISVPSIQLPILERATGPQFFGNNNSALLSCWHTHKLKVVANGAAGGHVVGNPATPGTLVPLPHAPGHITRLLCPTPCISALSVQFCGVHRQRQHRDQWNKLGLKAEDQSLQFLSNRAVDSNSGQASPAGNAVYNLPNAVSAARLLSGPVIGFWLLQGHTEAATIALVISGASDWLDGFLARRMGTSSVFGSYLDPLADKVLIGCVAGALLANGAMPTWLAVVVVGRDLLLVSGACVLRLRGFGWRWPGREAFFRTADASATAAEAGAPVSAAADTGAGGSDCSTRSGESVGFMRPLLISKANTVLQLVLLGAYLTRGMYGWPEGDPVLTLEVATAATTLLSLTAYGGMALQGKLLK